MTALIVVVSALAFVIAFGVAMRVGANIAKRRHQARIDLMWDILRENADGMTVVRMADIVDAYTKT
jgi:hypothetical protein